LDWNPGAIAPLINRPHAVALCKVADMMFDSPRDVLLRAALIFPLLGGASPAFAQDAQESLGAWFQSLRVPGTPISCCDESDCKRTKARIGPAGYEALTPDGHWISVPESAIIRGKPNLAREAVLCLVPPSAVYCFVPDTEG
jgi:hypothetical protein